MGIIGDQPHHANTFNGGFNSNDAKCWGGILFAGLSEFLINSDQNSAYQPSDPEPSSDWFKADAGTSEINCASNCPNGIGRTPRFIGPDDTESRILQDPLSYSDNQNEQDWSLKFQIYELIKTGEIVSSEDTLMDEFVYEMNNGEETDIMTVETGLRDLDTLIAENDTENEDYQELIRAKQIHLDTFIRNNLNELDSVQTEIEELIAEIDSIQVLIDSSRIPFQITYRAGLYNLYTNFLSESEDTLIPKQNLVRVLHLELKYRRGIALDSNELLELIVMAETCPTLGGKACYMASALLQRITDLRISPDLSCTDNYQPLRVSIKESRIFVSPNPSNGVFLVSWIKKPELSRTKLTVLDLNGKEMMSTELESSIYGQKLIDISNLSNGLYFLQLRDEKDNIIDSTKLLCTESAEV